MRHFNMPWDTANDRPVERQDRTHVNVIWSRFEAYRGGHVDGAGYALSSLNSFQDWQAEQRYAHQSNFDRPRALAHQRGANEVRGLVKRAQKDGFI